MSAGETPPPPRTPVGTIVLLGIAGLLYMIFISNISDPGGSDAAGNGLVAAFAALVGAVLWVVLAILLLVGGVQGHMPVAGAIGAVVLLPVSGIAAATAYELYARDRGWPILVPMLLPPLMAGYALWARLPRLHATLRPGPVSAAVGFAMLGLTVAPLVQQQWNARPDPARDARIMAEAAARQAQEQQAQADWQAAETAKFAALTPDSPLEDYLYFAEGSDDRARQARAGARHAKNRQADAIRLLGAGGLAQLGDFAALDLAPTSALCAAYNDALGVEVRKVDRSRSDYLSMAIALEGQLTNMQFLLNARCDLSAVVAELRTRVAAVSDSSRMDKFVATLGALHPAP